MSTEPVDHIEDRLKRAQDEGGYWGAAYFHDVLHLRRERDALRAERDAALRRERKLLQEREWFAHVIDTWEDEGGARTPAEDGDA